MTQFRSRLGCILAAIALLIVGCGGAQVSQPTTYTPDQLAEIQIYAPRVTELRDRFPELENYIQRKDWVDISSFIHGPMGELRTSLGRVASRLLPADEAKAKEIAEDLGLRLERLDAAAAGYDQIESGKQYRLALDDFEEFLSLIPGQDT